MATNTNYERAEKITVAAPAAANSGAGPASGDPLLFGPLAAVAQTSYTEPGQRVTDGKISIWLIGSHHLTVHAATQLSPLVGAAINPGDIIYADGGTKDTTTGITYGLSLDANSGGTPFGIALAGLTSGSTGTIPVRLGVA